MMTLFTLGIIALIYLILKRNFTQWQRLGFPTDHPFQTTIKLGLKEKPFGLIMADIYARCREKLVGTYIFMKPVLLVKDTELLRQILTSDFANFHDRGIYVDEQNDPLSANLGSLKGSSWRTLRTKLTPSFTSGKLKAMFGTIDAVGDRLINHLQERLKDGQSHCLEIKNLLTTYTIDVIGSVIFGLNVDSFKYPDNEFRDLSDRIFNTEKSSVLIKFRTLMVFIYPPIVKLLTRLGLEDPVLCRLRDIMKETIEFREQNGVVRRDLLQLLIQLRNTGKITDDNDTNWSIETTADNLKAMSIDVIAANAFLFYIAGSETTSAATAFTLYDLAMNPKVLLKLQTEIDDILQKHGLKAQGSLTYDAIQDMKYLDLCVKETTRKYPGLPFLNRECTQDYHIPRSDLTIPKGTPIFISLWGMHRDPELFPDPLDYKPERFTETNYNPMAYMPFGEGPRHCIAQRMGVMNAKIALVKILANFNIEEMPRKEVEFVFHSAPVLVPKEGLRIKMSKRMSMK
ncbi:cytochrome P450 6d1-like [Musca vetustissima]|uniref:cytochrome P450 6d1-like n=1 Tax=Musca vetustissima TaxID=27455 RepID=UPI002AB7D543|nr:cytochrome P450 6d1-like [Musca vetustissima]